MMCVNIWGNNSICKGFSLCITIYHLCPIPHLSANKTSPVHCKQLPNVDIYKIKCMSTKDS